ncbi:hypothetical protein JZU46_02025 [bacterium]|jgi:hypothetical protein|nr:hypothetical protein [bacterium]
MKPILLTQMKIAFVDDEDYEKVLQFDWYAHMVETSSQKKYYATRRPHLMGIEREPMLHRFVTNCTKRDKCRFIDGNSLNCQKSNLQVTRRSTQTNG